MSATPDPTRLSPIPPKGHSPRSPPISHFDDPSVPLDDHPESHQAEDAAYDAEDEIPYPEAGSEHTLLPPPNFNPFFTIVEDATSSELHHPYVHYIFADDDPIIVTAAAMRSLGLDDTKFLPKPEGQEHGQQPEDEDGQEQDSLVESPLPPAAVGTKERFVIIDIAADGHTIVDAQSMSPDWQITDAAVRSAPSFDESSSEQGYMLRIEGVEVPTRSKGKAKGQPGENKLKEAQERSQGDAFGALEGLVRGIEGRLEVAGKISRRGNEIKDMEGTDPQTEETQNSRRGSRVEP